MKADERRKMENQLMVMGLNKLSDPQLIPQMARLITDHEFFTGMLNACDQDKRYEMYHALAPYLPFKPMPLESYIMVLKDKASAIASKFAPITVGEEKFQETTQADATGAIVTLTCAKCTRTAAFHAPTPVQAMCLAREKGWIRDLVRNKEICPKCPAIRKKVAHA